MNTDIKQELSKSNGMLGRLIYLYCLLFIFVFLSYSNADSTIRDPEQLRVYLNKIRENKKLPAVAASVVIGDKVVAASAVGLRKWGCDVLVTRDDAFELGSITKPLTGTLLAILKEQKVLDWNTTIAEVFPEIFPPCYSGYKKVTVRRLLSHTSGLPYQPKMSQADIDAQGNSVIDRRIAYVTAALSDNPEALPGTAYIYSGGGIIAVSMAEKLTSTSWEKLVQELLFSKLDMNTAGFGSMATLPDQLDAPWYHQNRNGTIVPLPPDATMQSHCRNPVGKAVYCSVVDLGRFAAFHLCGMQEGYVKNSMISRKTFIEMYTPVKIDPTKRARYTTVGWRVQPTAWATGPVYWHSGQSQGRGYAIVHIVPEQNYATCVMTNIGGEEAQNAASEINLFIVEALRDANYDPSNLFPEIQQ